MLGHHGPLGEEDLRDHRLVAGDDLARDSRAEDFFVHIVPSVVFHALSLYIATLVRLNERMPEASAAAPSAAHHGRRFVTNVLWSWTGVAASFFQGLIIPPLLLRKLDAEHYGIWQQIFSILEYFWFFDLGLQSAITNFCARFLAVRDTRKLNEVISTALFYF